MGFRRAWWKRLGAAMQLFTKKQGVGFEDLSLLCQRCEQGLRAEGANGGEAPAVVELSDEDLLLRRAVGGAWSEAKMRRGRVAKACKQAAVEAGLRLQQFGQRSLRETERRARELAVAL